MYVRSINATPKLTEFASELRAPLLRWHAQNRTRRTEIHAYRPILYSNHALNIDTEIQVQIQMGYSLRVNIRSVLDEIELAARAQEDDEDRSKRGQAHHTANPAMGKGSAKGTSKEKTGAGKGKNETSRENKPVCADDLKDRGCPRGDKCTFRHPPLTELVSDVVPLDIITGALLPRARKDKPVQNSVVST